MSARKNTARIAFVVLMSLFSFGIMVLLLVILLAALEEGPLASVELSGAWRTWAYPLTFIALYFVLPVFFVHRTVRNLGEDYALRLSDWTRPMAIFMILIVLFGLARWLVPLWTGPY